MVVLTLPEGTVTFLFTDIQGSTPLWESQPERMAAALQVHNTALRRAIEAHGGVVFKTIGDAFQAVFPTAPQALKAAIEGQKALAVAPWNELGELKVRMGLHTGEAELDPGGDEYAVSHSKNRVARIMSAAYGGQVLLSQETKELVDHQLPEGVTLKDLGEHRLKGMQWLECLYQVCAPGLPADFPSLATAITIPNNLPIQLTSFIGRGREIEAVCGLLSSHRLVTLTGSGGVGKTRLSIQAAWGVLDQFPDGVWFVELAPVTDPELVPRKVAGALGLRPEQTRSVIETLGVFLSNRELLLILDNCEHLSEACARLAEYLLRVAPRLTILTSSRESLGVAGEYSYRVASMLAPDPRHLSSIEAVQEYDAVKLFVERGSSALTGFTVNDHNLKSVAAVCRRLDGIPLAIELAAARLNILTTEQLFARLDNAFHLLTGGSRTSLPRQQTLRATIDWSYQMLNDPEKFLLQRMAVFAGGAVLEGIEAICAGDGLDLESILDVVSGLVSKSMIEVERRQGVESRYRLLETVRQYAREKLYEAQESQFFHDRHLSYFLALAEIIEPQLKTPLALKLLEALHVELDNFRAALSWALERPEGYQVEAGLRLASALLNFWHTHSYQAEGHAWLRKGLVDLVEYQVSPEVYAKACFSAGHLIFPLGRLEEAQYWLEESLKISITNGNSAGIVRAQSILGEIHAWSGNFDQSKELGEASVALCRGLNDAWLSAWVLCRLGTSLFYANQYSQAYPLIEESLAIFERLGDHLQVGDHFVMLGAIALQQKDLEKALRYLNKALVSARGMNSKWTEANVLLQLGYMAHEQRNYVQMQEYFQKSVSLHRETGNIFLDRSLLMLGMAELYLGQSGKAVVHFRECLRISTDKYILGVALLGIARVALQANQANLSVQLLQTFRNLSSENPQMFSRFEEEFESAWIDAQAQFGGLAPGDTPSAEPILTLEQAVALALEVRGE